MKVKDFYKDLTKEAAIVRETDSVNVVIRTVLKDPKTRNAYVVDSNDKLVGVIVSKDVLDFAGKEFLSRRGKFIVDLFATRARDLMRNAIVVSLDTSAEEALRLCVENDLEELPVCKDGRVVGEVMFFEIIKALGDEIERRA